MDYSLADALGLTRKPEEDEPEEQEYSPAELKKIERDKIILESAANKGASIAEICEILREKGHFVSQRTVWTVLHSDKAAKYLEVLEQAQDRDIALLRAYALKDRDQPDLRALAAAINARERRIQRLAPNEKVKVEVNVNQQSKTTVTAELLARYELLVKTGSADSANAVGNISADNSIQQVDSSKANGKTNVVPEANGH